MFLALGAMIGQAGPNMLDVGVGSPILPVVSTLSLVLVLFTDAVSLDDGSPVQRPRRSANTFGHRMLPFGSSSLGWQPYLLTRPGLVGNPVGAGWQPPVRPDEMAGVAVRNALQVVLMLGLSLPESAGRSDFGHHLPRPETRGIDIGDGILGDTPLLVAGVEDRGAVARSPIVALAVLGRGIVNLEEELEKLRDS